MNESQFSKSGDGNVVKCSRLSCLIQILDIYYSLTYIFSGRGIFRNVKRTCDGCTFSKFNISIQTFSFPKGNYRPKGSLGATPHPVSALLLMGTQKVRYCMRVLEYSLKYSPSTRIANYSVSTALLESPHAAAAKF